jgi:hypothetical protein
MRAGYSLIAVALLLAGCASEAPSTDPSTTPREAEPTPTRTVAPTLSFAMPSQCAEILPESRVDAWLRDDVIRLGGPDGKYGDEYLADPSPEQQLGGITCIWGPSDSENSSVTVSVAPLSAATRKDVVTDLVVTQGLNEETFEGATIYWQQGDTELEPAILNVLRADSWISVIVTIGGEDSYADAEDIADEVFALVYQAS